MDLNGNDRRFVSDCQGQGVTDPEVSPDGKMISFTCFSDNGQALDAIRELPDPAPAVTRSGPASA